MSGAERIVDEEQVDPTVDELIVRAMEKGIRPDRLTITVDDLGKSKIKALKALDLLTVSVRDEAEGRAIASRILSGRGISSVAQDRAIELLARGPSPQGTAMRGAVIMDASTGERLESDPERGVRARKFDWSREASRAINAALMRTGTSHFRVKEALALATKVSHAPGVIAELCWSDDPSYTAGYVASLHDGYIRFPFMKPSGSPAGGRVFFVQRASVDIESLIRYLLDEPVLIAEIGVCRSEVAPGEFLRTYHV